VGAPGTGKNTAGQSHRRRSRCPFFSISGSDFVEMFVGVGASRVRDLFHARKKHAPCIIFIDEIDAVDGIVGRLGRGHDERNRPSTSFWWKWMV